MNFIRDIDKIRQQINECKHCNQPFLFAVNFELTEGFFIENPLQQSEVQFQIGNKGNKCTDKLSSEFPQLAYTPVRYDDYKQKFDAVQYGLKRGDSFLTNLTIKTKIRSNLSLSGIFSRSTAYFQLYIPDYFVCFSPERFLKIEGGTVSTYPMKGTIDADIPNAEQIILSDVKETAEHHTIVDLLRNDLSKTCTDVKVERFRYIDKIQTKNKQILQVSSEITGKLPDDYLLGDFIFSMLPAGSVSGAPKEATLRMIREAEQEPRGFYTGVMGYFDGEVFDSAVLIRFIEKAGEQLFYRSGGGITALSRCEAEYNEAINKIYFPF